MSSQLNVDTIVDKAGSGGTNVKVGNTSTYVSDGGGATQNVVNAIPKVWSYNNSSASPIDGLNVASGTDNGTGDYTFAYTSALQDTTPSAQCTNNTEGNYILVAHATTTTTIQVKSRSDGTAAHDDTSMFTICGDMA